MVGSERADLWATCSPAECASVCPDSMPAPITVPDLSAGFSWKPCGWWPRGRPVRGWHWEWGPGQSWSTFGDGAPSSLHLCWVLRSPILTLSVLCIHFWGPLAVLGLLISASHRGVGSLMASWLPSLGHVLSHMALSPSLPDPRAGGQEHGRPRAWEGPPSVQHSCGAGPSLELNPAGISDAREGTRVLPVQLGEVSVCVCPAAGTPTPPAPATPRR